MTTLKTEAHASPEDKGQHTTVDNVDPASGRAQEVLMPSQVAPPTRSNSEPQQASTQPGDGGKSHSTSGSEAATSEGKVPWKDQVLGYAKVTRGKVLGKQDTEDVGHKILQGEIAPQETNKHPH